MEAPGWDQLVSGEINSPLTVANVQNTQADVPLKQAQTQLEQASTARTLLQNQQDVAGQPLAAYKSQLELKGLQQSAIANAAALIDPNDPDAAKEWDAAMTKLADGGVDDAKQFIGRYNPALRGRVSAAFSANSATGAASAMSADPLAAYAGGDTGAAPARGAAAAGAGGLGAGAPDAMDPAQLQHMIDSLNPQQLGAITTKISAYEAAMQRVASSSNPQAQWDIEARALGHPEQVGQNWQLGVASMEHQLRPIQQVLQGRQTLSQVGLPAPAQERHLTEVGGALYDVDPFAKPGTPAQPVTPQGNSQLVGTDPDTGKPIYHNSLTGQTTVGPGKIGAKPGTAGSAGSVYAQKQQAWLDVHPGDTQGALDYAAGRGKTMSAPEMVQSANAQATREYQAIYGSGITPPPPEGPAEWIQNKATEDLGALQAANSAPAAAPGGGGGPRGGPRAAAAQPAGLVAPTTYGTDVIGVSRATVRNDWVQASSSGNQRAVQGVQRAALKLPAMTDPGPLPPASATAGWRDGQVYVTRSNGAWTLRDGKPARLW